MFCYFKLRSELPISHRRLIYLVEKIGRHYKSEYLSKESTLKKGIRKIQSELWKDKIYITKGQIKVLLRPKRENDIVKIPFLTFEIFEKINKLIHSEKELLFICKQDLYENIHDKDCHCRDNLVLDLFSLLNVNAKYLVGKSEKVFLKLKDYHLKC